MRLRLLVVVVVRGVLKSQTCPRNQLSLRQELHWHLGRLSLARLQKRQKTSEGASGTTSDDPGAGPGSGGDSPSPIHLAREARHNLEAVVKLAQAATAAIGPEGRGDDSADAAVERGRWSGHRRTVTGFGIRMREGRAHVELSKLCLAKVSQQDVSRPRGALLTDPRADEDEEKHGTMMSVMVVTNENQHSCALPDVRIRSIPLSPSPAPLLALDAFRVLPSAVGTLRGKCSFADSSRLNSQWKTAGCIF